MRLQDKTKPGVARRAASMGLLMALTITMSFLEGLIPALPMLPPGIKLGLSNIVVAYAIFYLGAGDALTLAILKSGFVFLTRGFSAGLISLSGGLLSVLVMLLTCRWFVKEKNRYFYVSIPGAVSHNIGQTLMAAVIMKTTAVFYTLPVLFIAGILMGYITAVILRTVLPALRRVAAPRKSKKSEKNSGKD